ncbi:MAG: sigma-70 family RNA polymerase sigma factor [Planctomycetes bacterium]|nr:sigma-70 family RNA polymerase sigma factor [Planctomycetota bacterium]
MITPFENATILNAIHRIRSGAEVEESFRILDARLRPRLLSYFRARRFSFEEADELAQSTLLRVFTGLKGLEEENKFLAWLFTIARRVRLSTLERRRRERRWLSVGAEFLDEMPNPRSVDEFGHPGPDDERLEKLREAMENLPAQQRQCLLLRVEEGMTYREIARTLLLSAHTVRNHLAAARRSLRRVFQAACREVCVH